MKNYQIHNEDCVTGMSARLADNSIDLTVTSIPFADLFVYSGKNEDIGNNKASLDIYDSQFALNMRFFCDQLFRVTKPGCNAAIHCQQLLAYKNLHGFIGRRDFRNAVIYMFRQSGFEWKGEACISKNPQVIAQRLKLHSLMFATAKVNSRNLAPAFNDYVLIFQKPGESKECPAMRWEENPEGWVTSEQWIEWARGVWEIAETDVLDNCKSARSADDLKHVCPLQLSVIYRCVALYSAPGETVLDPFNGIGSTGYVCLGGKSADGRLTTPRKYVGFETNDGYFELANRNMEKLEKELEDEKAQDLFKEVA